ncbi:Uncharacterised protein [Streptococcus parasanguinis]|uniref:hypothetical protein n=1 Tax=Streptococcus parasanguinis TaxID=1318 RepID=UPI00195F9820|nr:hypothetical protein [Streptococcus parasanguinis]VTY26065.1 Uncharacterised protein [Streptococcus parasanguinis]
MTTEDKQPFAAAVEEQMQETPQVEGQVRGVQTQGPAHPLEESNPQMLPPQWSYPTKPKYNWKKLVLFSLLALVISGLLSGVSGYVWGQSSQTSKESQRFKRLERAKTEANETKVGFVTDKEKVIFTWTFKDLGLLSYTNREGYGLTADQIVEVYGLASSVEYKKNAMDLTWNDSKATEHQNLRMRFEEVDGNYYLKSVSVTELDELYDHKNPEDDDSDDTSSNRALTKKEFRSLKKGNKQTGQGGTSLSEFLKKYRKTVEIGTELKITSNGETFKSTRVVATVLCEVEGDFKVLKFLAQPDGEFRYIGAELN